MKPLLFFIITVSNIFCVYSYAYDLDYINKEIFHYKLQEDNQTLHLSSYQMASMIKVQETKTGGTAYTQAFSNQSGAPMIQLNVKKSNSGKVDFISEFQGGMGLAGPIITFIDVDDENVNKLQSVTKCRMVNSVDNAFCITLSSAFCSRMNSSGFWGFSDGVEKLKDCQNMAEVFSEKLNSFSKGKQDLHLVNMERLKEIYPHIAKKLSRIDDAQIKKSMKEVSNKLELYSLALKSCRGANFVTKEPDVKEATSGPDERAITPAN